MNVQRFTGRTSRDAMTKMRQALGDDAVVLSTKPCAEGIEMLAMAPQALAAVQRQALRQPAPQPQPAPRAQAAAPRAAVPAAPAEVDGDVEQLAMSTLSFQDYVRERMLKKREATRRAEATEPRAEPVAAPVEPAPVGAVRAARPAAEPGYPNPVDDALEALEQRIARGAAVPRREPPVLRESVGHAPAAAPVDYAARDPQADASMLSELRSMKGLIEERFGALAFMEKPQSSSFCVRRACAGWRCSFSMKARAPKRSSIRPFIERSSLSMEASACGSRAA